MQLNHASGTTSTNALSRQIAARLFCVTLTYVTLRSRTGTLQIAAWGWPRYFPFHWWLVISTQSIHL